MKLCNRAGVQVHYSPKGNKIVGVSVDGQRSAMDINLTEATAHYLPPDLPSTYRLTSGAAVAAPG